MWWYFFTILLFLYYYKNLLFYIHTVNSKWLSIYYISVNFANSFNKSFLHTDICELVIFECDGIFLPFYYFYIIIKMFCFIFLLWIVLCKRLSIYYISVNFANSFNKSFLHTDICELVIFECDGISFTILLFLYCYCYFVINNVKILYFIEMYVVLGNNWWFKTAKTFRMI